MALNFILRHLHHVPGAPDGLDVLGVVGVFLYLLPEASDVHVQSAVAEEGISPHGFEYLILGNDRIAMIIKIFAKGKLPRLERDLPAVDSEAHRRLVNWGRF